MVEDHKVSGAFDDADGQVYANDFAGFGDTPAIT
jgi:hypothetical protein